MRRSAIRRLTALVLSWIVPATSVWSTAPVAAAESRPAPAVALAPLYRPRPSAEAVLSKLGERVHGPAVDPEPVAVVAPVDPSLPSFGILVGHVLSDATGLAVPSATVRVAGSSDPAQPVDLEGRYALPAGVGGVLLLAEAPGFTSVERAAAAVAGQGTAVLDARPTPLAAPVNVGPSGGPVVAGPLTVTVPAGAVSADTGFVLTPLSGQGLPGRLPLGFAPVQAFDLRAGGSVSGALTVRLTGLPSTSELHLVEYRPGTHAWHVTATSLAVSSGEATSSLPGLGAYAVVIADGGGPAVPGPGAPLVGSASVAAPPGLSGAATVEPIQVPSTGATARGHLTATSPTALPSGTVLQARLTESFTVGGVSIQDEPRVQDVIAYRAQPASGLSLKATLPLTAVRRFSAAELAEGRLHLEFWTGRPDLAGSVGGGTEAVTVESGPARLTVPAGSLDHDTSVSILSVPLSSFLPGAPGVTALGEVVVDLSGALLSQGAELSLAAGATAGETLLIARVERVGGVPYLTVVSLAEEQGGRVVSADYPGLPGIVRGGRYVFYRVNGPVGFVAGSTTSQAGPVSAVVGTAGLPFVGISSASGSYITAARPGAAVEVTATVPGTPHRATATVAVQAGQTASLDLSLTAGLTTVEVLPADGTTGVAVSVAVQVTASQALDELTVTATSVRLIKGNPDTGPAVPAARVLSADGRTLSVVPDAPLDPATVYALRVTGLKDVFGGPVNVPDTHFTTRADVTPEYDLSKVTFSFPNEAGLVHVSALAGSFPPASGVMIVNERNGVVLTLTVDNQGRLDSELPATLDDTLAVTLEDPQGNVVSGRQSRFVDLATGRMAVGTTGGVVSGTGGVELRLPEGAVDRGVIFKASAVNPTSVPAEQRPSLGEAVLASALSIEAPSSPTFRKEVDVAFPKPAAAPPGAFFYVVRKVQGPDGQVFFQTIDTASLEGDKVVTNSPPFSGYVESIGAFFLGVGAVTVGATATTMMFLMWSFDSQLPLRAQMGVISGRVTRSQWNPTLRRWEYAPVTGAIVRRIVNGVDPFTSAGGGKTFARSREDGTYSFFDAQYTGGAAVVKATDPLTGQEREASGYGIDPVERPFWAQSYRAMATANIAFTPTAQPRPEVDIRVLERQGGAWVFSDGLVTQGQPVVIGFVVTNAVLEGATLDGVPLTLRDGEPEHLGLEKVADHVPGATGAVTVVATARPTAGNPVTATASFLVIAEGDDNNRVLEGVAPQVIVPRLVPQPGASNVSPAILLEVAFTEPVTNLAGNVAVHELLPGGELGPAQPIQLFGSGPQGPVPAVTADSQVSLLTVRPTNRLKYETAYRLVLSPAIHDLDTTEAGDPKELAPFSADFETFRSGVVGGSQARYHSAGIVALEDRAWLVQNHFSGGWVQTFDVSDPVEPLPVGGVFSFAGRPVDLAGEANSTAIPGVRRLLVVGTTVTERSRPSNVHVFDVTGDTPRRIGAASVTRNAVDGTLARLEVKGNLAYAITWHKGVQVLDLVRARANYNLELQRTGSTWRMDQLLGQDGAGFGHDAVTQTIRVTKPTAPEVPPEQAQHWLMTDLKVGDYLYEGVSQPLVFVTGELGFAVINPQTASVGSLMGVQAGPNRLQFGYALALGRINDRDVAVVVGNGLANHPVTAVSTAGPVLAVLDLAEILSPSDPPQPKVLSVAPLFGGAFDLASVPTDVILKGDQAIVASDRNAVLVDLSNPTNPQITGQIEGIGGRLASGEGSLIFGSAYSVWGGQSELGGIRSASTGRVAIVTAHDPDPIIVSEADEVFRNVDLAYRVLPPDPTITSGSVQIDVRGGFNVTTLPADIDAAGQGSTRWPQGTIVNVQETYDARLKVLKDGQPVPSPPKRLRFTKVPLAITINDRLLRIQFAVPERGAFTTPPKQYSVHVFLAAAGQPFGQSASFKVRSDQVRDAYPNVDRWWDSVDATASFVTRRIEQMDVIPPGTDTSIDRIAFEIGTVLGSYPRVKVEVRDGEDRILEKEEGQATANLEWSAVISTIGDRIRAAAGETVPPEPELPEPGSFDLMRFFAERAALAFRVLYFLTQWQAACGVQFVRGLVDGFVEGVKGDVASVQMLGTLLTQDPVLTAKAMVEVFEAVLEVWKSRDQLFQMVSDAFEEALSDPLDSAIFLSLEGSYYLGCLAGFIVEQALVIALATWLTTELAGLGGVVVARLKMVGWIARATEWVMFICKSVRYFVEGLAVTQGVRVTIRVILIFMRESRAALTALWTKYPRAGAIVRRLAQAARISQDVAKRALYWLSFVDNMADAAAERLIVFCERKGPELADAWLTRWTSLTNGKRAVKNAFEAYDRAGEAADGVRHALVVAGNLDETVPAAYVAKYREAPGGDRVESSLQQLRTSLADDRYPDEAVAQAMKGLAGPDVPPLSDEAVRGAVFAITEACLR